MNSLKILLVLLVLQQNPKSSQELGHTQKLIYQKDISEHCRRRVVPSTFLGRRVMEANSRILLFSRLDHPYSCFISVRTESGSNMVMVIQIETNELRRVCSKNKEQLLVYEMGETFGGYWGPLPNSVIKQDVPQHRQIYTLKTTPPTVGSTVTSASKGSEDEKILEQTSPTSIMSSLSTDDYIEVEVPILNVSVHFEPGSRRPIEVPEFEEAFVLRDDVTPIPGVSYDSSILPLVQFRLVQEQQPGDRRSGDDEPPKYEMDILEKFTPDIRLTIPQFNPTSKRRHSFNKQRKQSAKHLNNKKHKSFLEFEESGRRLKSQTFSIRMNGVTKYTFPTLKTLVKQDKIKNTQDSWHVIKDIMEKLDKTKEISTTLSIEDNILLERILNINHSPSVYLLPNLTLHSDNYDGKKMKQISINKATLSTRGSTSMPENYTNQSSIIEKRTEIMSTKIYEDIATSHELIVSLNENTNNPKSSSTFMNFSNSSANESLVAKETRVDQKTSTLDISHATGNPMKMDEVLDNTSDIDNGSNNFNKEPAIFKVSRKQKPLDHRKPQKIVTGSMVGHESWENVVQAAPEMAVLLNQTVSYDIVHGTTTKNKMDLNETLGEKRLKRKKRVIHSISIEDARPHNLTTKKVLVTTTKTPFDISDMQEFAQLVELQDDELHGRVALRYLRQYVGPALFNLCDLTETASRHVHLFNSSRIVMAITNFTLNRMVIILTAARTLLTGETRCPSSQLECQVAGARVCLDSMVACDGVPNCGSYDIYDEDRVLCGQSEILKYNVYLASFTFLAVLLTVFYAVHYWLKRCTPNVADAFFVYTNGVENVLYLDTIMRSPNDTDDISKMVYHSDLYGDDNIYDEDDLSGATKNACQRFLQKICLCCRKKKTEEIENAELPTEQSLQKRKYLFTELEIRKMLPTTTDSAVQTGNSLEMKFINNINKKNDYPTFNISEQNSATESNCFGIMKQDSMLTLDFPEEQKDELSLLKFVNDAKTNFVETVSQRTNSKSGKKNITDNRSDLSIEKEIRSYAFDHEEQPQPGPSKKRMKFPEKCLTGSGKHLRFDDVAIAIPNEHIDDNVSDRNNINHSSRCDVSLGENRPWHGTRHLDTIEEGDEHNYGGKEHRNFWGNSKTKKSKKKFLHPK